MGVRVVEVNGRGPYQFYTIRAMLHFDLVVVGAGPDALKLAQDFSLIGKKVALVSLPNEPETLQSRILNLLNHGSPDLPPALSTALSKAQPTLFSGACRFHSPHILQIDEDKVSAARFVIASGATSHIPSLQGLSLIRDDTPITALSSSSAPGSALVLGAGPLGVATALHLAAKECDVTLISKDDRLLKYEDRAIAQRFEKILKTHGIPVRKATRAVQVREESQRHVTLVVEDNDGRSEITAESLVVATGLVPNTAELNLKEAGVYSEADGRVVVNDEMRTSASHIWAMGPVTGDRAAFSIERFQADLIRQNAYGSFFSRQKREPDDTGLFILPGKVPYTRIGLTEAEAKMRFNGTATVEAADESDPSAFLKLVGKRNGVLLGAHATGPDAMGMGLFFELMIRAGISVTDAAESRYFPPMGAAALILKCLEKWR